MGGGGTVDSTGDSRCLEPISAAREEVATVSAQLAAAREGHDAVQAELVAERQAHAATQARLEAGRARQLSPGGVQ